MLQVRATAAAHADLIKAHDWYELQSPGLGKEFIRAIDAAFAVIARYPVVFRSVHRDLRRVSTKRFPYFVYYECTNPGTARVVAILHTAMDQDRLKPRLP
jgi:toxin ParE1/3/4